MLTPFPDLLWLSFFAPFFLRIGLGLALFLMSFHALVDRKKASTDRFLLQWPKHGRDVLWAFSVLEILIGLSFVGGIYTQHAAVLAVLLSAYALSSRKYRKASNRDVAFYGLTLVISLSLVITGAGIFAFDKPL